MKIFRIQYIASVIQQVQISEFMSQAEARKTQIFKSSKTGKENNGFTKLLKVSVSVWIHLAHQLHKYKKEEMTAN